MKFLFVLIISLFVTACTKDVTPDTYDAADVGAVSRVNKGFIVSKNPIYIDSSANVQNTNIAAANEFDTGVHRIKGYQYIIKLDDGQVVSVVQNESVQFKAKSKVLIIFGKTTRIVMDETD